MVSVGTIVWLSSELMFFAALFAMYFSIRSTAIGQTLWAEHAVKLNLPYALTFTIILVLSSVTCQIGVFAAERGDVYGLRRWFALTFVMGLIFVLGQANEYRNLVHEGIKLNADGYGSMFYLTTGFHGLHVIGGLVALLSLHDPFDPVPVHPGAGDVGDRGVLLLALRRHRVDRALQLSSTFCGDPDLTSAHRPTVNLPTP